MTTRGTEGRREIEAAKQRLSAAKSHDNFISKTLVSAIATEVTAKMTLDNAKKNREDIEAQVKSSNKEVSDAKKFLAEAEKRWEVIEIDDSQTQNYYVGAPKDGDSSNKKRKVSVSPQGNTASNNNIGDVHESFAAGLQPTRNPSWSNRLLHQAMGVPTEVSTYETVVSPQAGKNNTGRNTTTQASQPAVDYDSDAAVVPGARIVVRVGGCGTKEANGAYEGNADGGFSQLSQWQGKEVLFGIYQRDGYWCICLFEGIGKTTTLYMTSNRFEKDDLPPSTANWVTLSGDCPAPQSIQFDNYN